MSMSYYLSGATQEKLNRLNLILEKSKTSEEYDKISIRGTEVSCPCVIEERSDKEGENKTLLLTDIVARGSYREILKEIIKDETIGVIYEEDFYLWEPLSKGLGDLLWESSRQEIKNETYERVNEDVRKIIEILGKYQKEDKSKVEEKKNEKEVEDVLDFLD